MLCSLYFLKSTNRCCWTVYRSASIKFYQHICISVSLLWISCKESCNNVLSQDSSRLHCEVFLWRRKLLSNRLPYYMFDCCAKKVLILCKSSFFTLSGTRAGIQTTAWLVTSRTHAPKRFYILRKSSFPHDNEL